MNDVNPEATIRTLNGTTFRPPLTFGKLRVLFMDDITEAEPRDYLLKGLMSPAEMSVWWGAPKCGKSFLMLHVAYAIAQGRGVFGRRVKPASVLYIAAEGQAGLAARLRAIRDEHGDARRFRLIAQPVDLLHPEADFNSVRQAARDNRIDARLIVVDTLSRSIAGGNENDPVDMGRFIVNIGALVSDTGAHVAVIHHGTKDRAGSTPRGHGSLIGAADLVVEIVKAEDGTRTATVTAAKDDPDGAAMGFALRVIVLGTDGDGDPITTCIVREADATPVTERKPKEARLHDKPALMLRELRTLIATVSEPTEPAIGMPIVAAVTRQMLRFRLIERGWFADNLLSTASDGTAQLQRTAFAHENKALSTLQRNGFAGFNRTFVWTL